MLQPTDGHNSKPRQLDDSELDSDDDLERNNRALEDDELAEEEQDLDDGGNGNVVTLDVQYGRHPLPEPGDGEVSVPFPLPK